jgi:hypothetical protein
MADSPSHARVVLTVRTKLTSAAAEIVGRIATRLAPTPEFRDDPEATVSAEVGAPLADQPEHVVAAAELAVLVACAEQIDGSSELDQMRLQMAMDRRSKLLEALSNTLKKSSDASDAIVANLK